MDQIYRLYDRQTLPKIYLKDYFQQYSELLKSSMCHKIDEQSEEKIFQLMDTGLSQTRTLLMTQYCSIDNLILPMEAANAEEQDKQGYIKKKSIPENILNNTSLETIKVLKILSEEASLKPKFQNGIPINFKNEDLKFTCDTKIDSMIPYDEFLVYVRIYEPFQSQPGSLKYKSINALPILKLKNVMSIPGCQTLYELRQKIACQSDLSVATEISENPNQRPGPMAKHIYKSGFFYIEDTFYNISANVDYSSVILEWAATRSIGPFKVASMDVKINTLCARFGFPWVYQHQGCCEHLIVLSDARLVTVDDILTLSVYPKIERIRPIFGKNCIMCGILNVHWIITEHDRIPHDISYFCNKCFKSYNYVDSKKVGNFKAYNYPCIPELLSVRKCNNI